MSFDKEIEVAKKVRLHKSLACNETVKTREPSSYWHARAHWHMPVVGLVRSHDASRWTPVTMPACIVDYNNNTLFHQTHVDIYVQRKISLEC